ncbi:MAG TPA: hypothetical protein VIY49_36605 [Bryobacteraceae bacterium]
MTSYPEAGPKITISTEGGTQPSWSHNGRELFYRGPQRQIMSVDIEPGPPLRAGRPKVLFTTAYLAIDPEPDGKHFLAVKTPPAAPQAATDQITIVFNWFEELRRRAPIK